MGYPERSLWKTFSEYRGLTMRKRQKYRGLTRANIEV